MLNPILLLASLNASSLIDKGGCYPRAPPGIPQIIPPAYHNCVQAATYIPQFYKSHAPMSFGRHAAAGYVVPKVWIHRDCVLRSDVKNDDDVDEATFERILTLARGVTVLCVKQRSPHLGGSITVGNHGLLSISVYGYTPETGSAADISAGNQLPAYQGKEPFD